MPPSSKFSLALVQLLVTSSKETNLANAKRLVLEAANKGAKLVVLPECFNSPYGTQHFPPNAEPIPTGPTSVFLSQLASQAKVYLIGGSIPETSGSKLFNTCTVWSPTGTLLATHRKLHLFDINVKGGIKFKESEVLSPGEGITVVDMGEEIGKVGVGICYDVRFPEMAMVMARSGCKLLVYPGAFNMTTGPLHWELLTRARALDNQLFVALCSPARDKSAGYIAYAHSTIANPMGKIIATAGESEEILQVDVDYEEVETARGGIPCYSQRRFDVYPDVKEGYLGMCRDRLERGENGNAAAEKKRKVGTENGDGH
ncbi:hypothetical protein HDV05_001617 [Chytridiales sp. JEL 0842]|nr:hypothetical protein HDV05_001617 [Chytridiales sp. JEL 0842]